MTSNSTTQYRREIDGLRALAVMAVVIYHADFSIGGHNLFDGGFVGVDIFFVISGYLITRIIWAELNAENFSFISFWERRARRILPALFTVILATVPLSFLLLTNSAFVEYANSVVSTVFFASNYFFWLQDSYTAEASQLKPLLHTWSLSIEEQYYLAGPAALWVTWNFKRSWIKPLFIIGIATSLGFAQYFSGKDSSGNFYLLTSRVWEFLSGSILAVWYFDRPRASGYRGNKEGLNYLPTLGFILILASIVFFDDQTPHPTVFTIVPILGVCLIITFANQKDFATKLLSTRAMVGVGLISYSFYLWHFPIFAFGRIASSGHQSQMDFALWIIVSMVMAVLSWNFVERPFRNRRTIPLYSFIPGIAIVSAVVIGVPQYAAQRVETDPFHHIPKQLHAQFQPWSASEKQGQKCIDQEEMFDVNKWCDLGVSSEKIDFLLLGDSHAHAQAGLFDTAAKQLGMTGKLINRSGCPMLIDLEPSRGQPESQNCLDLARQALEYAIERNIRVIFVASRWNYYVCGVPQSDCGYTQNTRLVGSDWAKTEDARLKYLSKGLLRTANAYSDANIELRLITQVPHQPRDAKTAFSEFFQKPDQRSLYDMSGSYAAHLKFTQKARNLLADVANGFENVSLLDQSSELCPDKIRCPIGVESATFYTDDDHISPAAILVLKDWTIAELGR